MRKTIPLFVAILLVSSNTVFGADPFSSDVTNVLVYGEGTTEITTSISEYESIVANKPINGTIFVTHDSNDPIDENSFRIGDKPLKATFVQSTPMSSPSTLVVTIFSFDLDGLPVGNHTLPSISVTVAGKEYQAAPLTITVAN